MSVLIAYRSRYGTTEACARRIADLIPGQSVVRDLRNRSPLALQDFDTILLGGSIYGGRIQREIPAFCERERESLLAARVGLFICCLFEGERGMAELEAAFPPWLLAHSFARELLGGELVLRKLSPADRLLVRSLVHPARDLSTLRADAMERLAAAASR